MSESGPLQPEDTQAGDGNAGFLVEIPQHFQAFSRRRLNLHASRADL
jgi:hypothetical protein